MSEPPKIFDRALWRKRRARARLNKDAFLHERAAADIVDRLETTTRTFDRALFYGAEVNGALLNGHITTECGLGDIYRADISRDRLEPSGANRARPSPSLVADEEFWPFAPSSFDLVVSFLTLHHANDLVGALSQMRASLKPDGLFIAALFGEETLSTLKSALYESEAAVHGGVSARISPFASVRDLGGALQRAGFALPVADIDRVRVAYQNHARLFEDLRAMGETNILKNRGRALSREILVRTISLLDARNEETVFDLVYLTGWAPHESQPKPLKPGSATHSLAEALKSHDI